MTTTQKNLILALLLSLLTLTPTWAQESLTGVRMRSLGINASTLQPITFNHSSSQLVAFDRAPFEMKKQGVFYRLWFFEISPQGQLGEIRSVDLPLKSMQQGEFTPDDKYFIALGNRGTTFLAVDMSTLQVKALMNPNWGEAGFRADPAVLWTEEGSLFVLGRPYDKERFVETRTVARVTVDSASDGTFERGPDITTLEKSLDRLWFTNYVSDKAAFFGQKYPSLTILSFWDGEAVTEIDRAWKYTGFWGNAGRLLYTARRAEQEPGELALFDSATGTHKVLARDPQGYRYLFLSRDGQTALVSQLSETAGRVVPFYARESDDWALKPLVTDKKGQSKTLPAGWMRLSSDGGLACHIGARGLQIFTLP